MERYCVLNDCKGIKFQLKDKMFCFDVNFKKNVWRLVKEQGQFKYDYGKIEVENLKRLMRDEQIRSYIDNFLEFSNKIYDSYEYELDILEEMILTLLFLDKKKKLLYKPDYLNEDELANYKNKMRNSIKNLKADKTVKNRIFDASEIKNAKVDTPINSFGSGIVVMWLLQSKFRNLFESTDVRNEKYEKKSIIQDIAEAQKNGVEFNVDDCIIWEKLLGIQLSISFQEWILPFFISTENKLTVTEETLVKLLEAILQYEGQHICCAIIQMLGCQFWLISKTTPSMLNEDMLKLFTLILNNNFQKSNLLFKMIVKDTLEKYSKFFTIETIFEIVNIRRNEIQ